MTTGLSKCAPLKATVKLPDNMVCMLNDVHTAREQDGMLILESFDYGLVAAFTKGEWLSVTITTPERDFTGTRPGAEVAPKDWGVIGVDGAWAKKPGAETPSANIDRLATEYAKYGPSLGEG